ncbi:hypothetical protein PoB_005818300 [Plakobranchus ocellatus]|uniref:Uncharacterized protein n=1 Tax=Plakobranchus ocellatus TaxID=259542 RepID=A0AAV4CKQ7_9GAST|nr:hypothetical protein PoB_005818300 [Plakobranchus ocellatus]
MITQAYSSRKWPILVTQSHGKVYVHPVVRVSIFYFPVLTDSFKSLRQMREPFRRNMQQNLIVPGRMEYIMYSSDREMIRLQHSIATETMPPSFEQTMPEMTEMKDPSVRQQCYHDTHGKIAQEIIVE